MRRAMVASNCPKNQTRISMRGRSAATTSGAPGSRISWSNPRDGYREAACARMTVSPPAFADSCAIYCARKSGLGPRRTCAPVVCARSSRCSSTSTTTRARDVRGDMYTPWRSFRSEPGAADAYPTRRAAASAAARRRAAFVAATSAFTPIRSGKFGVTSRPDLRTSDNYRFREISAKLNGTLLKIVSFINHKYYENFLDSRLILPM